MRVLEDTSPYVEKVYFQFSNVASLIEVRFPDGTWLEATYLSEGNISWTHENTKNFRQVNPDVELSFDVVQAVSEKFRKAFSLPLFERERHICSDPEVELPISVFRTFDFKALENKRNPSPCYGV